MEKYGSFQAGSEIGRESEAGVRWYQASQVETGQAGLLKLVPATGTRREALLRAWQLQRELAQAPGGGGWLPILECGERDGDCFVVYEPAEPQLLKDIESGTFEPTPRVVGQVCRAILEALLRLQKNARRPHGNLKLSNVLFLSQAGRSADYGHALLTDLHPLTPPGPARSDQWALGVLLYRFIRADARDRPQMRSIPDDRPLWPSYEVKRDGAWRKFVEGLMNGTYDDSLEAALRECKRLNGGNGRVWLGATAAALAVMAGVLLVLLAPHRRPLVDQLQPGFHAAPELQADGELRHAFASQAELDFERQISQWWKNPETVLPTNDNPFAEKLNAALAQDLASAPGPVFSTNLVSDLQRHHQTKVNQSVALTGLTKDLAKLKSDIANWVFSTWSESDTELTRSLQTIILNEIAVAQLQGAQALRDCTNGVAMAIRQWEQAKLSLAYGPPDWRKLSNCRKTNVLVELKSMALGKALRKDSRSYAQWKEAAATPPPPPLKLTDLLPGWPVKLNRSDIWTSIAKFNNDVEDSPIPLNDHLRGAFKGLRTEYQSLNTRAESLESKAADECAETNQLSQEGGEVLAGWRRLLDELHSDQDNLKQEIAEQKAELASKVIANLTNRLSVWLERGEYDQILADTNHQEDSLVQKFHTQAKSEKLDRGAAIAAFHEGQYTNYDFIVKWGPFAHKSTFTANRNAALEESNLWSKASALQAVKDARAITNLFGRTENQAASGKSLISNILARAQKQIIEETARTNAIVLAEKAYQAATDEVRAGNYENALNICHTNSGIEFTNLAFSVSNELHDLLQATTDLNTQRAKSPNGEFGFLTTPPVSNYLTNREPPWTRFFAAADAERIKQKNPPPEATSNQTPPKTTNNVELKAGSTEDKSGAEKNSEAEGQDRDVESLKIIEAQFGITDFGTARDYKSKQLFEGNVNQDLRDYFKTEKAYEATPSFDGGGNVRKDRIDFFKALVEKIGERQPKLRKRCKSDSDAIILFNQ